MLSASKKHQVNHMSQKTDVRQEKKAVYITSLFTFHMTEFLTSYKVITQYSPGALMIPPLFIVTKKYKGNMFRFMSFDDSNSLIFYYCINSYQMTFMCLSCTPITSVLHYGLFGAEIQPYSPFQKLKYFLLISEYNFLQGVHKIWTIML
jgi:hypothetical protein